MYIKEQPTLRLFLSSCQRVKINPDLIGDQKESSH